MYVHHGMTGSRVAYATKSGITIRRISGEGRALRIAGAGQHSINLTRYQAAWIGPNGMLARTQRFAGSGGPYRLQVTATRRQVPGIVSLAVGESTLTASYIDAEGVKRGDHDLLR